MAQNTDFNKTTKSDIYKIDPRRIIVKDGFNSRQDFNIDPLAEQIREKGVLNPISVQVVKKDGEDYYQLVDGERRYRACMKLIKEGVDIARIPALVLSKSLTDEELLIQQVLRNEGKPFTEYEYGLAFRKMMDFGHTITEISKIFGKNQGVVSFCVQHLERDSRIQQMMRDGKITGGEVRAVVRSYGGETEEAINEIVNICKVAEAVGESKGSLALMKKVADKKTATKLTDADLLAQANKISARNVELKDTAIIRNGLDKLFTYVAKVMREENIPEDSLNLDIEMILSELKSNKDKTLREIIAENISSTAEDTERMAV